MTIFAMRRMRRDKRRYDQRRTRYESRRKSYEDFVREVNAELWNLHNQRVDALKTLREAADFLAKANVKDRSWSAKSGITAEQFAELKDVVAGLRKIAASVAGGAVGGAALGAASSVGLASAALIFGTASTGTAISALSGIAAQNAALAWLGGGTLAAGGAGIAGGAALLTGVALAPIAILPAIVAGVQAWRQSNRIDEEIANMEVSEAEMDKHSAELSAVLSRTREFSKALSEIHQALKDILALASADKMEDIHRVYLAAKKLAELLNLDADLRQLPPPDSQN